MARKIVKKSSAKLYGDKFVEVSDTGDTQFYIRHFGHVGTEKNPRIELVVVAEIQDLENAVSADELPEEGNFQLSINLVPYEKYLSPKIKESATEDSSSDNVLVDVVEYMGGLNYQPQEKVFFKTAKAAEKYLHSKEFNDRIGAEGMLSGFIMDKHYNRIGQTNWEYLAYMTGESSKFEKGGSVGGKRRIVKKAGESVATLFSKFNKEKPAIALYVIAGGVSGEFIYRKHDNSLEWAKWGVLSDSEKKQANEKARRQANSFEQHLVNEFLRAYYSDGAIKKKCAGESRATIAAINSVMKSIAKEYDTDKYAKGGGVKGLPHGVYFSLEDYKNFKNGNAGIGDEIYMALSPSYHTTSKITSVDSKGKHYGIQTKEGGSYSINWDLGEFLAYQDKQIRDGRAHNSWAFYKFIPKVNYSKGGGVDVFDEPDKYAKGGELEGYLRFKEGITVKVDEAYLKDEASPDDATATATVISEPSDDEELVQIQYENGSIDYLGQDWLEPVGDNAVGAGDYGSLVLKFMYPKHKRKPAVTVYHKVDTSKEVKVGGSGEKGYKLIFKDGSKSDIVITERQLRELIAGEQIESSGASVSISGNYGAQGKEVALGSTGKKVFLPIDVSALDKNETKKLYLDYVNNFVTIQGFADYYELSDADAKFIIDAGNRYKQTDGHYANGGGVAEKLTEERDGDTIVLKRGKKVYAEVSYNKNPDYKWTLFINPKAKSGMALSGFKSSADAIKRANELNGEFNKAVSGLYAKGGEIRRFDRHEEMGSDTRDDVMSAIAKLKMLDGDYGSLENYLYGLFDGYDYSQTDRCKEEMQKLKSESRNVHDKIEGIFDKVSKYNFGSVNEEFAKGGGMGDFAYKVEANLTKGDDTNFDSRTVIANSEEEALEKYAGIMKKLKKEVELIGVWKLGSAKVGKYAKGGSVGGKRKIVKKWYSSSKPDEKTYVMYDFARNEEQAKNMLRDLHEGSPIAHKSTSQGGEYNIYVKRGSVLWREKGGSVSGKRKIVKKSGSIDSESQKKKIAEIKQGHEKLNHKSADYREYIEKFGRGNYSELSFAEIDAIHKWMLKKGYVDAKHYYSVVKGSDGQPQRKNDFDGFTKDEIVKWWEDRGGKYNPKGEEGGTHAIKNGEFFVKEWKQYDKQLPKTKRKIIKKK